MNKYATLINILDELRKEAPMGYKKYYPSDNNIEGLNKARSRTFIHLYLKVKFGLLEFEDRENFITDDTNDGGLDAYYIDEQNKVIYFIQSKFRNNKENFEEKNIELDELYNMELDRITKGESTHDNGQPFNSKITNLISKIAKIPDYPKYKEKVIILANLKDKYHSKIKSLTTFDAQVFDYEKSYNELVFPVISGSFYNARELKITLNVSPNASSNRIDYFVDTELSECNIRVIFVPVSEIAKLMYKYRNSILKFNPRSFLELASGSVNDNIKRSITHNPTNEFALFNNGITMLSDYTYFKDRTAKKFEAELLVTNPQIINGGQTAFTLSRIYEDILNGSISENVFDNKEVLLKVITFSNEESDNIDEDKKLNLIEKISKATNNQTAINEADRRSNEKVQIELQDLIYKYFGLFYERKKGEFADGIRNKYIDRSLVIDRDLFLRCSLAVRGNPTQARRSSSKNLFSVETFNALKIENFISYFYGYLTYMELLRFQKKYEKELHNKFAVNTYGNALRYGKYAVLYASHLINIDEITSKNLDDLVSKNTEFILNYWSDFEEFATKQRHNTQYFFRYIDEKTKQEILELNFDNYYKGRSLNQDLTNYFTQI